MYVSTIVHSLSDLFGMEESNVPNLELDPFAGSVAGIGMSVFFTFATD